MKKLITSSVHAWERIKPSEEDEEKMRIYNRKVYAYICNVSDLGFCVSTSNGESPATINGNYVEILLSSIRSTKMLDVSEKLDELINNRNGYNLDDLLKTEDNIKIMSSRKDEFKRLNLKENFLSTINKWELK